MTMSSQNNLESFKFGGYFYDRMYTFRKATTNKQINHIFGPCIPKED